MKRYDRVILIGFMAAGKTTVGRVLASRLGWRFVDLDEEIERRTGYAIADLFAEQGEAAFRELEAEATEAVRGTRDIVLAPGGGWITRSELLASLRPRGLVVWLRVSAREAVRRSRAEGRRRPLLQGDEPLSRAAMLLAEREPYYRGADLTIDTEGQDPTAVAVAILEHLRS